MTLSQIIKQQEEEFDKKFNREDPLAGYAIDSEISYGPEGNVREHKKFLASSIRLACEEMGRAVEQDRYCYDDEGEYVLATAITNFLKE